MNLIKCLQNQDLIIITTDKHLLSSMRDYHDPFFSACQAISSMQLLPFMSTRVTILRVFSRRYWCVVSWFASPIFYTESCLGCWCASRPVEDECHFLMPPSTAGLKWSLQYMEQIRIEQHISAFIYLFECFNCLRSHVQDTNCMDERSRHLCACVYALVFWCSIMDQELSMFLFRSIRICIDHRGRPWFCTIPVSKATSQDSLF
jgi:hypothetical protein